MKSLPDMQATLTKIADDLEQSTEKLESSYRQFMNQISKELPLTPMQKTRTPEAFGPMARPLAGNAPLVFGALLHNTQGNHNKQYTITVSEIEPNKFVTEAAWGRIGTVPQVQTKYQGLSESTALGKAHDLLREKKSKGYREIQTWEHPIEDREAMTEADWGEIEDPIVDPAEAKEQAGKAKQPPKECDCTSFVQELGWTSYEEPEPPSLAVAPYLTTPGFGLVRYASDEPGPRWVVGVVSDCSAGFLHARAVEVGPEMKDAQVYKERHRSKPHYVESLVQNALTRQPEYDHVLVVEENLLELVVVDALRWAGKDVMQMPWFERRQMIESEWPKYFVGDQMKLASIFVEHLREQYLGEGDQYRFELVSLTESNAVWQLPKL